MDRGFGRLERADLTRLREAVKEAQQPGSSIPHREVLRVHEASPKDAGLTVDLEASAELGMPLLVVRIPMTPRPSPALRSLTPREFEVAGLVSAGLANKEIAARLGVRTSTVKEHVHRILHKTGLPSRSAMARAYVGGMGNSDGTGGTGDEISVDHDIEP